LSAARVRSKKRLPWACRKGISERGYAGWRWVDSGRCDGAIRKLVDWKWQSGTLTWGVLMIWNRNLWLLVFNLCVQRQIESWNELYEYAIQIVEECKTIHEYTMQVNAVCGPIDMAN